MMHAHAGKFGLELQGALGQGQMQKFLGDTMIFSNNIWLIRSASSTAANSSISQSRSPSFFVDLSHGDIYLLPTSIAILSIIYILFVFIVKTNNYKVISRFEYIGEHNVDYSYILYDRILA
ncbi:hypothetical protein ACJX0J_015286 [Zea mays]